MIAVDTNVVVRLIVADNPDQVRRARKVFEGGDVLVTNTVLMETAWVLASGYGLDRATISMTLRRVLGLQGVRVEKPTAVARALEWHDAGIELDDALHVAGAEDASAFVTFDEKLVRRAAREGSTKVKQVPR